MKKCDRGDASVEVGRRKGSILLRPIVNLDSNFLNGLHERFKDETSHTGL